ncbi:MAG: HAD family hydrolase [Cycloclasticus pugetii]|jgi:phosphoglycolate phosphatase|uniref:HAD family hydrolase n=1 Tax=Cycloclasticus pugetii TaxID=34068 RepID=UPI003A91082C
MITQYDLIIFDWDGTLVDSIDWIVECIQAIAKHQGIDQPSQQACKDIIGLSLSEAMVTLFPELSDDEKIAMVAAYREVYLAKKISTKDLFVDTLPTLEKLKQMGKTLAVATGKGQSGLDRSLDGTGLRPYFDHLRCAEKMQSKPSPHMLFDILDESGIQPDKAIMIGDSTLDLKMANNAGVSSIGVTTGAHSHEILSKQMPVACINNLMEIFEG